MGCEGWRWIVTCVLSEAWLKANKLLREIALNELIRWMSSALIALLCPQSIREIQVSSWVMSKVVTNLLRVSSGPNILFYRVRTLTSLITNHPWFFQIMYTDQSQTTKKHWQHKLISLINSLQCNIVLGNLWHKPSAQTLLEAKLTPPPPFMLLAHPDNTGHKIKTAKG